MITRISTNTHEEWLALRSRYIGGSDAAAVVGLNPWSSPYSLWCEKTGKIPAFEGNLATEVGSYLEEFIAKQFEKATGKKVRRANQSILNDKYPFAIANIDREIVGEDAGLECKSTSELNLSRFKDGEFPTNYYCQCVHYLGVTEKKRWYLAVLIGNKNLKIYQLTRVPNDEKPEWCEASLYISDSEIASLMQAEAAFWDKVEKDINPGFDGSEATAEALKTIFADSCPGRSCDLTAVSTHLAIYSQLKGRIKELEEELNQQQAYIMDFMQDAEKGSCGNISVSFKTQERRTFDRKAYEADHGEIADKYFKVSTSRPFKLTMKKEK